MPKPTMHNVGRPLTEVDLDNVEQELGVSLPESYRVFLLETNGGAPEPDGFTIRESEHGEGEDMVHYFFSVDRETPSNNLVVKAKGMVRDKRLTPDLVPIAGDPGGNFVCLGVSGARRGQVFFWNHENPEHQQGRIGDPIADDFGSFFENFHD